MDSKKIIKGISMITQLGFSMMVPIGFCGVIGYFLTENFHSGFWFIFFILLGILAGFRNTYILIKKFYGADFENSDLEKDKMTERRKIKNDKEE